MQPASKQEEKNGFNITDPGVFEKLEKIFGNKLSEGDKASVLANFNNEAAEREQDSKIGGVKHFMKIPWSGEGEVVVGLDGKLSLSEGSTEELVKRAKEAGMI
ncbi:MAG: hypothetical protein WCW65_00175 [Candidatus Paceibacterota bacterium]